MDSDVREKYTHRFSGVNFYKLKLHDESVKPVVQHVCRILFGSCKKVDAKLDERLELSIIEEVMEGPSGWILSLVVHKSGRDVRVCVDMHQANKAIVREWHPIPTVEKLLHNSNGSTVFVRQISRGVFTRFYSVTKVATSLPLSCTKVLLQVLDVWSDIGTGGISSDHYK